MNFWRLCTDYSKEQKEQTTCVIPATIGAGMGQRTKGVREMKILVIDDEQIVLDSVKKILTGENFQVDCFASSREGLDQALKEEYDLVLTDIRLIALRAAGKDSTRRSRKSMTWSSPIYACLKLEACVYFAISNARSRSCRSSSLRDMRP
jgi:hypothetical protein